MKPDLSGGKSNSIRGAKDCCGCADADRNNSRKKPRGCGEPYAATNGTYGFGRGDTGDPGKRATGPYLTLPKKEMTGRRRKERPLIRKERCHFPRRRSLFL